MAPGPRHCIPQTPHLEHLPHLQSCHIQSLREARCPRQSCWLALGGHSLPCRHEVGAVNLYRLHQSSMGQNHGRIRHQWQGCECGWQKTEDRATEHVSHQGSLHPCHRASGHCHTCEKALNICSLPCECLTSRCHGPLHSTGVSKASTLM